MVRFFLATGVLLVVASRSGVASLHPNELAGVLTLYLPLTVALVVARRAFAPPFLKGGLGGISALQLVLLTLLFGLALTETGSRGGLLSTGLAVAFVLAASGRRGRRILAAGVLAAALVVGVLGPSRVFERLIYQGSVQGYSLELLFTGRLAIWRQGMHALADFPVTGLGVGKFGEVAQVLYPGAGPQPVEDAHQFFLQTALDLGIPGATVLLIGLALLVHRLLTAFFAAPRGGLRHAVLLGWFGGLGAHLLYSLSDSVSLGSPGNVAFWLFCGLGVALSRVPGIRPRPRVRTWIGTAVLIIVVLVSSLVGLDSGVLHNRGALTALRALGSDPPDTDAGTLAQAQLEGTGVCRSQWLIGLLADRQGHPDLRDTAWSRLIRCSSSFFELLETHGSRKLAELAVDVWPEHSTAHFWLARVLTRESLTRENLAGSSAIDRYRRGLELTPTDGQAWLELARLLARDDPRQALKAYIQACRHGDPGANGCVSAGRMAEELGDVETAIRWYRASRWGPSRARADELERRRILAGARKSPPTPL